MATGAASGIVNAWLASVLNGTAPTTYINPYVQLHTGAPGAAGTTNVAGNTTRVQLTGTFTISGGSTTNPAAVSWTSVSTAETYSDVTLWSASTGGTFIVSGTITANAVSVGDNFSIPIGDMTISQPVAS
jgi:hypothetical protein